MHMLYLLEKVKSRIMANLVFDEHLEALRGLSPEEQEYALKILQEIAIEGRSDTYSDLLYEDYKEIPVDIETFITNDNYLGRAWKDSSGNLKLYPFWLERLKELFPDNLTTSVNNFIASGARGLGKSEVSVGACCAYLMYRVMCLKDPLEYFGLKPTEKVCFAFMNITKTLSEEIAVDKFQKTIQMSPWFMARGTVKQRNNVPYWEPPEPIAVIIGSQSSDIIGQPIYFCLDEDTVINTTKGDFKISELEDKLIKVNNIDRDFNVVPSDECTVKCTGEFTEEYEIEMEDGTIIKCTPNHRFMLIDGTYKEAKDLTEPDEIFSIGKARGF